MENKFNLVYRRKEKYENIFSEKENYSSVMKKFIIKNSFGKDAFNNVIDVNIRKIISCIKENEKKQKILLFGEVQSGKTNNMIFLTAALRDLGINKFIIFTGTKNNLNEQNISRFKENNENAKFLDFRNKNNFFSNENKTEFLYGIKQNINNIINNFKNLSHYEISNMKIAILDDESDEASPEKTKKNRTINSNISNLLELNTSKNIYILITATPYANLTSYTELNSPDFLVPLSSSENYCGLELFNKNNLYKTIDDNIIFKFNNIVNDKDFIEYIKKLICEFNLKCFRYDENFQFLINVSSLKIDILNLDKLFQKSLGILKVEDDEYFRKYIGLDEIKEFKKYLQLIKIKYTFQGKPYNNDKCPEIIIGGNLLSRGITFENLIMELMLNYPNNGDFASDTLLQRARWFGYRKYLTDMVIYTSAKAIKFYENIENIEKKIRSLYINNYEHNNSKLEEIKNIFKDYSLRWTN